jgi:NitT/TauT family transport system substrate-binding protein
VPIPMSPRRARPGLLLLLALGLLLAACGGPPAAPSASSARPTATAGDGQSAASAPAVAAASPATRREPLTLNVGYIRSLAYAPLYVAYEKGYFRERGLELQLEAGSGTPIAQVAAGQLQLSGAGIDAGFLNARARGIDLRFILPLISVTTEATSTTPLVVRKELWDSGAVRSVADLRGRKVAQLGTTIGITYYLLNLALETGGLTTADVELVKGLNFPDMPQALAQGAIDAALLSEPFATLSQERGITAMLAEGFDVGTQSNSIVVNGAFAREHPDAVVDFAVAHLRGVRDLYGAGRQAPEHLALIEEYTKVPAATIVRTRQPYTDPNGALLVDSLMAQQLFLFAHAPLELAEPLPADRLVDTGYARRAVEILGEFRPPAAP